MKKQKRSILIVFCALFAAFTLGLFLGRSSCSGTITVSVNAAMQIQPPLAAAPAHTPTEETQAIVFPIDINTADDAQLQALPGIGPVLSQRILAYREANGPFTAPEDLMQVEGIGEKRMTQILEWITIGG